MGETFREEAYTRCIRYPPRRGKQGFSNPASLLPRNTSSFISPSMNSKRFNNGCSDLTPGVAVCRCVWLHQNFVSWLYKLCVRNR